jgi:tetratricopeptide (TPR) repeat protein
LRGQRGTLPPSVEICTSLPLSGDGTARMILLSAAAAVLLAPNILSAGRDDDAFGRANSLIEQGNRKQSGGDPDAAISLYTLALTLAPRLPAAYVGRGIAEEAIGKLAEAVHDYRQAIRINPDFAVAHNDYASVLYQEGNIDEALAEFAKAIKLDKHLPEPHLARGMIYLFQGKMEMAIDDFTKAIELFPSYFANGGELVVRNPPSQRARHAQRV